MHAQEFTIHQIKGHIEELFLAEYPDKLLLLDGGCRADVATIIDFVEQNLRRSMQDMQLIVSTHKHPDHVAAAPILRKLYGIKIAAFYTADNWYAGVGGSLQHKFDILMAWFVALKSKKRWKRMYYPRFLHADFHLKDGDTLPGFVDWQVIHAPGHTDHDIVLYHPHTESLYAADVVLRVNKRCLLPFPITLSELMEQSLRKLAKLPLKHVYLAHGGYCDAPDKQEMFFKLIPMIYKELGAPFKYFKLISHFPRAVREYKKRHHA